MTAFTSLLAFAIYCLKGPPPNEALPLVAEPENTGEEMGKISGSTSMVL